MRITLSILLAGIFCHWSALDLRAADAPGENQISPPTLNRVDGVVSKDALNGEKMTLYDQSTEFALFLPPNWSAPKNGEITLTIHFHTTPRYAFDEHMRCGLKGPLLGIHLGAMSSAYRKPFEDRERLGRLIDMTAKALQTRGAPKNTRITAIEISSFSAGYSAVREILAVPAYFKLIRRIVLCDSLYAGYESKTDHSPSRENINSWVPFVTAAARGEKSFVLTHSQVATPTYANSGECAAALIAAVGAPIQKIAPGATPAASDPDFPLLYRSDLGKFHVWGYAGNDAQAHMTHLRHMADTWMVLDAIEKKSPAPTGK